MVSGGRRVVAANGGLWYLPRPPPAGRQRERRMVNGSTGEQRPAGVYGVDPDGREHQVHLYQGGP